jgi:hypothetical protein
MITINIFIFMFIDVLIFITGVFISLFLVPVILKMLKARYVERGYKEEEIITSIVFMYVFAQAVYLVYMRHTSYIMLSLDMFILIMLISFFSGFLTGLGAVLINTDVIEKISRRLRAELYKDPCEHSS